MVVKTGPKFVQQFIIYEQLSHTLSLYTYNKPISICWATRYYLFPSKELQREGK